MKLSNLFDNINAAMGSSNTAVINKPLMYILLNCSRSFWQKFSDTDPTTPLQQFEFCTYLCLDAHGLFAFYTKSSSFHLNVGLFLLMNDSLSPKHTIRFFELL